VNPQPLLRHLRLLIRERHPISSPASLRWAERYLLDEFRQLGLQTSIHAFEGLGGAYHNVVASIPARSGYREQPALIIAAHYDTVMGSPGADDNASGLAVLLEVARRLKDVPLAREARFIGFCLEEEDLLGSLAYVSGLRERSAAVLGAIVLECVGFTRTGPGSQLAPAGLPIAVPACGDFLAIVANSESTALAEAIEQSVNRGVPELRTVSLVVPGQGELFPDTRRSDHAAFWHYGYPAVMLTDTADFRNPHYHRASDTLETLDLAFLDRVAEAVLASAMALAGTPPGEPVGA
jgi:Zn-dependent M28 family amino/carboxypeptidase